MKFRAGLLTSALLLSALIQTGPSAASGDGGSALGAQSPGRSEDRKKSPDRRVRVLAKLETLLEPLGVRVKESKLISAGDVGSRRKLKIKWEAYEGKAGELLPAEKVGDVAVGRTMTVIENKRLPGRAGQRYDFSLWGGLFVAAVNDKTELIWWDVTSDARLVFGDTLGPDGKLTGGLSYDPQPTLFINVPDADEITAVWILMPKLVGQEHILELLAVVPL